MSAQRVVAFVTLQRRPLLRRYVAGSLWLDASEERAHANLRSALWRLNRCGVEPVAADDQQLRLADGVKVDFYEAEAAARRALVGPPEEVVDIDPSGLAGDLLPDWYEDWALLERERHRQVRMLALDTVSERLLEAGRLSEALAAGLAAVAGDPLRESGHRAVVRAYLAGGNTGEAIRQYRFCRRLLADQLSLEPSEQMQELIGRLEASRPLLASRG
jgi:DNA-binding SARP family transcriptional activator